ncbi:MAG TPA: CBS domain-containing protein [Myxococcales bacterium]|nr:CBS domain-containing protein [Myxococcales bacterium]
MPSPRTAKQPDPQSAATTPVRKIMSKEVVTVRSGTSLDAVVELMLARGLSRLPVVDEGHRPLGIVSKTDVVQDTHDRGDTIEVPAPSERGFHVVSEGAVVDEVMTRTVVSASEDASVQRVAELMVSRHVHGLPVVNAQGELAGFVSTMDVLAWLAGK